MRTKMKMGIRYLLVTLLSIGAYFAGLQLDGNFHEAIPGELYRSAQLSQGDLTKYVHRYGIRSVINLRGSNPSTAWYQQEVAEAQALSINHIDFRMSAKRELTQEQAVALIEVMRNAPKPLLIHCQAGADRTGLASAFYVAGIKNGNEFIAELQLSPLYGHLPLWFAAAYPMNETFEKMEPIFGYYDS